MNDLKKYLSGVELYYRAPLKEMIVVPLSVEREIELVKKYRLAGDLDARDEILKHHLLFAATEGLHAAYGGLEDDEVISISNLALMKALDKFEYEKGVRFSSYARWFIMGDVKAMWKKKHIVKVPFGQKYEEFWIEGREYLSEEADHTSSESFASQQESKDRLGALYEGLNVLNDKERKIVYLHYLDNVSFAAIGRTFDPVIHREVIRKTHEKAITKLRRAIGKKAIFSK